MAETTNTEDEDRKVQFPMPDGEDVTEEARADNARRMKAIGAELEEKAQRDVDRRRERWLAMVSMALTGVAAGLELNAEARARIVLLAPPEGEAAIFNDVLERTLRPALKERVIVDVYAGRVLVGIDAMPAIHVVIPRLSDVK
jgi:hypothetical protein